MARTPPGPQRLARPKPDPRPHRRRSMDREGRDLDLGGPRRGPRRDPGRRLDRDERSGRRRGVARVASAHPRAAGRCGRTRSTRLRDLESGRRDTGGAGRRHHDRRWGERGHHRPIEDRDAEHPDRPGHGARRAAGLGSARTGWRSSPATPPPRLDHHRHLDPQADRGSGWCPDHRHVGGCGAGRDHGRPGCPVVVRETDGWLAGDGSSLASIDPPKGARTAIAFALDTTGQRLAVAWLRADGSVTLSVHAAAAGWRSVATPTIAPATGAAVTWLR